MITFILNNELVSTGKSAGSSLLDFIRNEMELPGTKTGCREGDCGACTVLMGTAGNRIINYKSIVSCLSPLGIAHGRHIVTIEGLDMGFLTPVQKAFIDNSATQCGFCTPGFVMALTANSLAAEKTSRETAIAAISGNICRCTGYKSIEKAAVAIAETLKEKDIHDPVRWLVEKKHLPAYFLTIYDRLHDLNVKHPPQQGSDIKIAGGTDLMVQKAGELAESGIFRLDDRKEMKGIVAENGRCSIGAATTISELGRSDVLKRIIPGLGTYLKLIASEAVRNMATIGGNIINASPIGDMSVIMLALDAEVIIESSGNVRPMPLKDLFLDYKKLNINNDELIRSIVFNYHTEPSLINFEKVSKRTHLDIASVNSAISITMENEAVSECTISAGGVSPVPLYLKKTSNFLKGKPITAEIIMHANELMQSEIAPISDVRGSKEYKRLLLRQLLFAHFLKLFPGRTGLKIGQL